MSVNQINIVTASASKITCLSGFLTNIPKRAIKCMTQLDTLAFMYSERASTTTNFTELMEKNQNRMENLSITSFSHKLFGYIVHLHVFKNLTSLHLKSEFKHLNERKYEWKLIVNFINKCPSLQKLALPGVFVGEEECTPELQLQSLSVDISMYSHEPYVEKLMTRYKATLVSLEIVLLTTQTSIFFHDWELPNVKNMHIVHRFPATLSNGIQTDTDVRSHFRNDCTIKSSSLMSCKTPGICNTSYDTFHNMFK